MSAKEKIRLQRYLAQSGVASRRKSEEMILAGRVSVNGRVVRELGTQIDSRRDRIEVDRKRVMPEDHVWLVLNKPDATVSSTHDPEGRQTVIDVLPRQHTRLYPVGRLDYHTEGVLLLTNDGELANALLHPQQEIPRTYHVKIKGDIRIADLDKLREGVTLDTGQTVSCQAALVRDTSMNTWIEMTIKQGINHQIHRMLECVDKQVLKLIRTNFAGITVEGLPPGKCRELGQREINELRALAGLTTETRRSQTTEGSRRINREAKPTKSPVKQPSKSSSARSATTRSAPPRSGTPRSGTPRSATPRSGTPRSATPRSGTPRSATPRSGAPRTATGRPPVRKGAGARGGQTDRPNEDKRKAYHEDGTPKRRTLKGARAEKRQANAEGRERNRAARQDSKSSARPVARKGTKAKTPSPRKRNAVEENGPRRGSAASETDFKKKRATTVDRTRKPTERPTRKPTERPTRKPTERPTRKPTERPTRKPTERPTRKPTERPTRKPAERPKRGAPRKAGTSGKTTGRPQTKRPRKSPPSRGNKKN